MPYAHDEAEPADTTKLSEPAVEEHLHGICFKTGPPERVGVELEWLVHADGDVSAPVDHDRVTRSLADLTEAGELPGGGRLTIEPGGQVEISSAPAAGIGNCITQTGRDLAAVREALRQAGLTLAGRGVDPYRLPARVLDLPRYAAMEEFFDRGGPWGRVMMCSTASVQVCVDAGRDDDGETGYQWRWRLLHALGPVLVAAFANSPLRAGRPTGWKSTRQAVWAQLDPGRTRAPAGAEPWPAATRAGRNRAGSNGAGSNGAGSNGAGSNGAGGNLAGRNGAVSSGAGGTRAAPGPAGQLLDAHGRPIPPANHIRNDSTSNGNGAARPGAGTAGRSGGDPGGRTGQGRWGATAPGWPPNPRGPGNGVNHAAGDDPARDGAGHDGAGRPGPDVAGPNGAGRAGGDIAGRHGAGHVGAGRAGGDVSGRGGAALYGSGVPDVADPRVAWARYALDAEVMCVRRGGDRAWSAPPGLTFRDWLRGRGCEERPPTQADLAYHLSTLFPPVRPQGHLEVRFLDAQPGDGWIVPAAVVSALADDPVAAQVAMAAVEEVWRHEDGLGLDGGGPPAPWLRAARQGLADPVLARAARDIFAAADAALGRAGAAPDVRRRVAGFAGEYAMRGRCPADDTLEDRR
jgi:gamma-glutamylcysteine synthetase